MSTLTNVREKTVFFLRKAWQEISGTARQAANTDILPSFPKGDEESLRKQMQLCLDSPGGDISARAQTAKLGHLYQNLNSEGRATFLRVLAEEFDIDYRQLAAVAKAYTIADTPIDRMTLEMEMRGALVTPRSIILRQFTVLQDGFKFLVNMRADILPLLSESPQLQGLEYDLKNILSSWFDVGLLDLVEIGWNSPAALLEKIMKYEAVHKVASWDDMKNRLDADRRVFAFFHNKMPLEPLIFVHVALVEGMSTNIQQLLDENSPVSDSEKVDTAIFYSISNAQKGLAGISFGNFLIKRVVSELSQEMKNIQTFATLSPVPGFRTWLDPILERGDESILLAEEKNRLRRLEGQDNAAAALKNILNREWHTDSKLADALQPILMRLCARYLIEEKRGSKPRDPVAAFHLFNGARLERMNWLGDTSANGMKQSAGIMVNYHYKLSKIDENHEVFVTDAKIVASKQVKGYLK